MRSCLVLVWRHSRSERTQQTASLEQITLCSDDVTTHHRLSDWPRVDCGCVLTPILGHNYDQHFYAPHPPGLWPRSPPPPPPIVRDLFIFCFCHKSINWWSTILNLKGGITHCKTSWDLWNLEKKRVHCIVCAIYFTYRYFHDFGLGGEICDGLILQFLWCFHYYKI